MSPAPSASTSCAPTSPGSRDLAPAPRGFLRGSMCEIIAHRPPSGRPPAIPSRLSGREHEAAATPQRREPVRPPFPGSWGGQIMDADRQHRSQAASIRVNASLRHEKALPFRSCRSSDGEPLGE